MTADTRSLEELEEARDALIEAEDLPFSHKLRAKERDRLVHAIADARSSNTDHTKKVQIMVLQLSALNDVAELEKRIEARRLERRAAGSSPPDVEDPATSDSPLPSPCGATGEKFTSLQDANEALAVTHAQLSVNDPESDRYRAAQQRLAHIESEVTRLTPRSDQLLREAVNFCYDEGLGVTSLREARQKLTRAIQADADSERVHSLQAAIKLFEAADTREVRPHD